MEENNNEQLKKTIMGFVLGVVVTCLVFTCYTFVLNIVGSVGNMSVNKKINTLESYLNKNFVGTYDKKELEENMYRGLVAGVNDRYTTYMDKNTYTQFKQSSDGSYAGIGATVGVSDDNKVEIISTYPIAPAAKAGIKPGDKILKINGTDVTGDKLQEATNLMKGKDGTTVNITVWQKALDKINDIEVMREKVDIPTVSSKMMDNNTGYIRITNFDGVTADQYKKAYKELESKDMKKLIIDLRDNPGGLLNIVSEITDTIVPKGVIVYTEDKNGNKKYEYSDDKQIEIPLVLLVNENSASASEVLTEAVKDYEVGTIVGEKTFGKGVVQGIYDLPDGSGIKITMAKYFSPKGVCIQGVGIEPDILVPYDEDKNGSTFDLPFEQDVQLQEAFKVVNDMEK